MKLRLFTLFITTALFSCKVQTADRINLTKLVFHSSRCNGTCPKIDIEIDQNRNIFVDREYFKTKSETDSIYSGKYQGMLTQRQFDSLLTLLQNAKIETLTFEDTDVMDLSETIIIIYYNGHRKYLKSTEPPSSAYGLIAFLKSIGNDKTLGRTNEAKEIEN